MHDNTPSRLRRWSGVLLLLALPALAAPDGQEAICDDPSVIMCDNFEARAPGSGDFGPRFKNRGWSLSTLTNINVINTPSGVFEGSRALQFTYPQGNNTGGGFMDIGFGGGYRTLYSRWYTKWSSNFVWSYVATKHNEFFTDTNTSNHLIWFGAGGPAPTPPRFAFGFANGGFFPGQNQNGVINIIPDRWYCFEVRVTMNSSPNATDGTLQAWIDGVQHFEYPMVNLDNTGAQKLAGHLLSGYWNCWSNGTGSESCSGGALDTHPLMYRWHDNFVVSTQPIGCLGTPPNPTDAVAPAAPTALTVT